MIVLAARARRKRPACPSVCLAVQRNEATHNAAWDDMIVLCAGVRWDDVKMADRHMAECLAALGPVLYVDPPVSHLTRLKSPAVAASMKRPRLRVLGPGLARLTPVVPPKPTHPAIVPVATRVARHQLRRAVRRLGGSVLAVISTWLFLDAYGACGEQRRVYWWTDDPVGAATLWGHTAERMAAADERLARASDLIVAVSEDATRRLRERGLPAAYLPNGCDAALFAGVDDVIAASDVTLDGPIAAFVGHLNSRTDLALLEGVADSSVGLLLIGPKDPSFEPDRFARLIARGNVAHLGPRPFEELPAYLKLVDVGLVPYGPTEFNRWSFPMKTLEYLAAGRPVVATSLPAIRWLNTDLVTLADTPGEFAASVSRQAPLARQPELVARRRAFAGTHSWAHRADQLKRLLEQPV
jgi:teichuronic acid biosynthesis glycosyltransferase TuaH